MDDLDAESLEDLWRVGVLVDLLADGADVVHDIREADGDLGVDAQAGGGAGVVCEVGGVEERLGRHAAGPRAIAAELLALDEHRFDASVGRDARGGEARGTTADDDIVEVVLSHLSCDVRRVMWESERAPEALSAPGHWRPRRAGARRDTRHPYAHGATLEPFHSTTVARD